MSQISDVLQLKGKEEGFVKELFPIEMPNTARHQVMRMDIALEQFIKEKDALKAQK